MRRISTLSRNSIAAGLQVVVNGLALFLLYRFLFEEVGIRNIGLWSLVMAISTVAKISDLGLSAAVVPLVARARALGQDAAAATMVNTAAVTMACIVGILGFVAYALLQPLLPRLLQGEEATQAAALLPYALLSFWTLVVAGVFVGALDGCQRTDIRAGIVATTSVVGLVTAYMLVPSLGLKGLAIAQTLQYGCLAVSAWYAARRQLRVADVAPAVWSYLAFKSMLRYGLSMQITSIASIVTEPIIKALIGKYAGLESLGFFDLANKLVMQLRGLIVECTRVIVAEAATLQQTKAGGARLLVAPAQVRVFLVSVGGYGALISLMPTISILWLGDIHWLFVQFAILMSIGWFANTLIGPVYFHNLGIGLLRPNVISHVTMSGGAVVLSFLGVHRFGGIGAVVGYVAGIMLGSAALLGMYSTQGASRWAIFFPPVCVRLALFTLIAILPSIWLSILVHESLFVMALNCTAAGALLIASSWAWVNKA